jgi:hypothetical protein
MHKKKLKELPAAQSEKKPTRHQKKQLLEQCSTAKEQTLFLIDRK